MASEKIQNIVEEIKGLSILEVNELKNAICEEFGVSADAPVVVAGAAAADAPAAGLCRSGGAAACAHCRAGRGCRSDEGAAALCGSVAVYLSEEWRECFAVAPSDGIYAPFVSSVQLPHALQLLPARPAVYEEQEQRAAGA